MHFGTYMGIYWILKFILFPLGFHIPFLSLLFVILTLSVPFIGYHYAKMYRDKICGGSIQFSHAMLFTIFMYMFASLLVAVAHYAYFQFIDHGFIINSYIQLWDELMTQLVRIEPGNTVEEAHMRNRQLIARCKVKLEQARLEQENVNEKMLLELMQAANNLDEARLETELSERSLEQAEENMKVSGKQYEVGLETLSDYLEAQVLWQQAYQTKVDAHFQLYVNYVAYLKAAGQLQ